MDSCEVKRARRVIVIAFSVVCAAVMFVLCVLWMEINRPLSPQLTIENLESAMKATEYQVLLGGECYLLTDCEDLGSLCCYDSWNQTKKDGSGQHSLTFKLGEQYELAFYEDGFVQAYDGYSSSKYQGTVWYQIPEDIVSELAVYVLENGVQQEMLLGPKSWFVITE